MKPRTYRVYLIGFGTPDGPLTNEQKCSARALIKQCDVCSFVPEGMQVGECMLAVIDGRLTSIVCVGLEHDGKVALMTIPEEGATA